MEDGRRVGGDVGVDLGVGGDLRPRRDLPSAMGVERRLGEDLADQAHALAHHCAIDIARQVVGVDHRRGLGIGASQGQLADALGPQLADRTVEHVAGPVAARRRAAEGMAQAGGAAGEEVDLHVRCGRRGIGLQEGPALVREAAERALAEHRGLGEPDRGAVNPQMVIGLVRRLGLVRHHHMHMVLQVAADALQLGRDRESQLREAVGVADAGVHQRHG